MLPRPASASPGNVNGSSTEPAHPAWRSTESAERDRDAAVGRVEHVLRGREGVEQPVCRGRDDVAERPLLRADLDRAASVDGQRAAAVWSMELDSLTFDVHRLDAA